MLDPAAQPVIDPITRQVLRYNNNTGSCAMLLDLHNFVNVFEFEAFTFPLYRGNRGLHVDCRNEHRGPR